MNRTLQCPTCLGHGHLTYFPAPHFTGVKRPIYLWPKQYRYLRAHTVPRLWIVPADALPVRRIYRLLRDDCSALEARSIIVSLGSLDGAVPVAT